MYSEADVDISVLGDQKVTVLGYGSQGRAHALNLKDSGFNVVVGLRKSGASWSKAEADGLTVQEPNEAVQGAAIVMFLTPDMVQKALYQAVVDDIDQDALLLFAHGLRQRARAASFAVSTKKVMECLVSSRYIRMRPVTRCRRHWHIQRVSAVRVPV